MLENGCEKVYRDAEEGGEVPRSASCAGWEIGLLPTAMPEDCGGFGNTRPLPALAFEEFAWGDLAVTLKVMAPNRGDSDVAVRHRSKIRVSAPVL